MICTIHKNIKMKCSNTKTHFVGRTHRRWYCYGCDKSYKTEETIITEDLFSSQREILVLKTKLQEIQDIIKD